jgi:hypothetical protein
MKHVFLAFILLLLPILIIAQDHQHHKHGDPKVQKKEISIDTNSHKEHISGHGKDSIAMVMSHSFSRNLPMARNASGTAWHPDNSPMFMNMFHIDKWMIMLHYGVFLDYTNQNVHRKNEKRGDAQLILPDWFMAMGLRPIGKNGLFMIRSMISTDPIIMGGFGYPLLFQTGETWRNEPLVDRQHPHELISELSVGYSHAFNRHTDLFLYLAMPGEPALGAPAFMHRPSASNIPASPLGHHWQDATHILFGVATLGLRYKNIKLEGSSFNGSEPNENRLAFDKPRFNSYSTRLSINPCKSLAIQTSYGYLFSPELHEPGGDVERYSASILHGINFSDDKALSSSLVWGMNKQLHPDHSDPHYSNALLLESNLLTRKFSFFTRIESVQKSFHELGIEDVTDNEKNNLINSFSFGASKFLYKGKGVWVDLGALGTYYLFEDALIPYYGKNPFSIDIFLRLIPSRIIMK